jgi:TonB family protein
MINRAGTLFCFVAAVCIVVTAQTEPVLTAASIPRYPPLARQARIEGTVKLTFTLSANAGEPTNVEAVSGHPILKGAAVENVKTWKFENPYAVERKYETTFKYRIGPVPQKVSFESFHSVEIMIPEPPPIDAQY